jgi:alcohol dehydrogenase class IV
MLPHVIRFNGAQYGNWYRDLLEGTGGANGFPKPESGFEGLADFVGALARRAGLPDRLSACGVEQAKLPELAAEAAKQWTGGFNPRRVGEAEYLSLYEAAY